MLQYLDIHILNRASKQKRGRRDTVLEEDRSSASSGAASAKQCSRQQRWHASVDRQELQLKGSTIMVFSSSQSPRGHPARSPLREGWARQQSAIQSPTRASPDRPPCNHHANQLRVGNMVQPTWEDTNIFLIHLGKMLNSLATIILDQSSSMVRSVKYSFHLQGES